MRRCRRFHLLGISLATYKKWEDCILAEDVVSLASKLMLLIVLKRNDANSDQASSQEMAVMPTLCKSCTYDIENG